jgi:protein-S-isoprenylcysteine O-methyltransferase Ste14
VTASSRSPARWLKSTSNRTFVLWPVLLLLARAALDGGRPELNWWGLPLLAWGYAQYRLIGQLRTARGGGGPGLSVPPQRLVTDGPYRLCRNPMYLGHLLFFLGLAILAGWPGWIVFAAHCVWFDRRARGDEQHLAGLFGSPYADYMRRVKRWLPWVY